MPDEKTGVEKTEQALREGGKKAMKAGCALTILAPLIFFVVLFIALSMQR